MKTLLVTGLSATLLATAFAIVPASAQTCSVTVSCTGSPPPPMGSGNSCTVSITCGPRR